MPRVSATCLRLVMRDHTDRVGGVLHLPGRQLRHIITCSNDGSLGLWYLESGAEIGGEWRDESDDAMTVATTISLSPQETLLQVEVVMGR